MSPFLAELIGTGLLTLLGCGTVANVVLRNTKGHQSGWIVIVFGWGMAVFCGVSLAAPYSGAHLNPAVTAALALAGKFDWANAPAYLLAQLLGGFCGAVLCWLAYRDHFAATEDGPAKLAVFSTGPAMRNPVSNLLTEIIGTFVLVLVVLYFAPAETNGQPIGLGAVGSLPVALLVVGLGIALGGPTGYAINPARDLGPRLAHALLPIPRKGTNDWGYSWIPIAGPLAGALAAAGLYLLAGA